MKALALEPPGRPAEPLMLRIVREFVERDRSLAIFAAVLLALLVPAAIAAGIDERVVRGVNVWIKPMKFALAIAVLALTTAWFIGHLPAPRRGTRAVRRIAALLIATGSFELGYITLQAALGEASHYNVGDAFHGTMYTLMGIGALGLTATQPMLAWQLHRHGDRSVPPAYRLAVLLGLVLTFVLGAGVGSVLSAIEPPTGPGLPLLGWSTVAGDLRPAHFVGIHAGQILPLVGIALVAAKLPQGRAWVWAAAAGYSALCAVLVARAFAGLPFVAL
jgi:hypothetical protein